ncbi:hypothetical protein, unlikely [Trypanosoma brucei gambiense DAL972]|uniref:Uncharacterized protein n=1 Tax=Trypanosoma brucei gambiense (strain MHOM/CI/86/DAL972) TaxID=679716 RepID=C9ZZU1_TRYB9|nr:hypothetical protein, unlikely [Trypanosoma brucei gambiense DAL972]CBH16499.1 hypothetical protein, unlikely [Trypanosoma brucei gambiense DAL972]|eukprot:XP_011778763.1 hypothetical protein, unlikely [Trypanosoma brucei gambiense DAL972]
MEHDPIAAEKESGTQSYNGTKRIAERKGIASLEGGDERKLFRCNPRCPRIRYFPFTKKEVHITERIAAPSFHQNPNQRKKSLRYLPSIVSNTFAPGSTLVRFANNVHCTYHLFLNLMNISPNIPAYASVRF